MIQNDTANAWSISYNTAASFGLGAKIMAWTSAGDCTFASTISFKGATPGVNAGQTDLGVTTTTTVITTAGGIALPALASTFWVVNVSGVKYGVPCFAL